jgi:antitoxin MazE
MEVKTVKWVNSLAFRIPTSIVKDCGLTENTLVDISFSKGEIIIKPLRKKYTLSELMGGITPENIHDEVGMDKPEGQELL